MKYYLDTDIILDVWYKINNKGLLKRIILPPIDECFAMIQFDDSYCFGFGRYIVEIIATFKEDYLEYSYCFNMTEFLGLNKIDDFDLEFDYNKNKKELNEINEIIYFNEMKRKTFEEALQICQNNKFDDFLFKRIFLYLQICRDKEDIEKVFYSNGIRLETTKTKMLSKAMNTKLENYDAAVEKFLQGDWKNEAAT